MRVHGGRGERDARIRCSLSLTHVPPQVLSLIQEVEGVSEFSPLFIHLDEAQLLLEGPHPPTYLRDLCNELKGAWAGALWPVVLVTGLRKFEITTALGTEPLAISLEPLTADDYVHSLRGLHAELTDWTPNQHVLHMLEDVAGPPRLLQVLLSEISTPPISSERKIFFGKAIKFLLSGEFGALCSYAWFCWLTLWQALLWRTVPP